MIGAFLVSIGVACSSAGAPGADADALAPLPRLDGVMEEGEWEGAEVHPLGEEGEVRFLREGSRLYVAIRGRAYGWAHVYLGGDEIVRVLHASAALGDATYRKGDDGRWAVEGEFTWRMRDSTMTDEAAAARRNYLERHGWVATTNGMGDPPVHELVVDLDAVPAGGRIAVLHATDPSETIAWPSTEDATREPGLVQGSTPASLDFEPSTWAGIEGLGSE